MSTVTITSPINGANVPNVNVSITGTFVVAAGAGTTTVTVNGTAMSVVANAFSGTVHLPGGTTLSTLTAIVTKGTQLASTAITITVDHTPLQQADAMRDEARKLWLEANHIHKVLNTATPPSQAALLAAQVDRKSTRLNSSHIQKSRMPSSA